MCGIVGYAGTQPCVPVLIDGLKRLEYRGYDSAGMSFLKKGDGIVTVKTSGKVRNLEAKLPRKCDADTGIAHTRWATHGSPTEINAHPHTDEKGEIAVVHNGIIENHAELRRRLEAAGHKFASDTDSEVIPHLIEEFYQGDLPLAVSQALNQVRGTYGIAVICSKHPGLVVAARHGSPVVVGLGKNANIVASDVTALVAYTRNVIYLNDGEMAILTPDGVDVRTLMNAPLEREVSEVSWDIKADGKGEFDHYMLKEIYEQPESVENTIRGRLNHQLGNAVLSGFTLDPREMAQINRIVVAACGSSLHAGLVGEYYFEDISGIPATAEQAAEFRYRNPIILPNTLVIPISQSGETADTLAAVREAVNKGAIVSAICNVVGSTIARESGRGIYLHAGPEISVASTKAFTCQVTVLLMLALLLGRNRRLDHEFGTYLVNEIQRIPDLLREVLKEAPNIERLARKHAKAKNLFYIGRGCLYPAALEGALKLKEISYVHAEGYHAAELKHGPIALLDENVPVIALCNNIPGKDKMLGNIQECKARKAPIIAVVTGDDDCCENLTPDVIRVPNSSRFVAPITTVVALQIFSYYFAMARGCEIDQPRNLAKSVTVE